MQIMQAKMVSENDREQFQVTLDRVIDEINAQSYHHIVDIKFTTAVLTAGSVPFHTAFILYTKQTEDTKL